MKVAIKPSVLDGVITAPASKSSMQRACAGALISHKKCIIKNPGRSNDDKAALEIVSRLGAKVTRVDKETIAIESAYLNDPENIHSGSDEMNCGESGLCVRMFTPLAALSENTITITGEGSLLTRPIDFFDQVLPQLNVNVKSNQGKLPVEIKGPLMPRTIEVDGSLSSQFLTGLLMAYSVSPVKDGDPVSIKVQNLKSKPYIDLTLDVMNKFGLFVPENKNYEEFIFNNISDLKSFAGDQHIEYTVEGDWSNGAFLLVAGAIAGNLTVRGLGLSSTQADRKIIDALMSANASLAVEAKGLKLHPRDMNPFVFDATDCPDLFPPLVALASRCNGVTTIKGVSRLTHKESNRGVTLQQEFAKMGLRIDLEDELMLIYGGAKLNGAAVHSHKDHRIAMACAVAALGARGETVIEDAEAVNKSYPDFYEDLRLLGASISNGVTIDMNDVRKVFEDTKDSSNQ